MKSWLWAIIASTVLVLPLSAQTFEGWQVASTEHFSFIFEPNDQSAIDELLTYSEEVYAQVTEFLGSRPPHVTVVVYGRSDYGNGYFSSLPPAHIGLYVTPPTEPLLGVRTESWLRGALTHELAHYVQMEYQTGPLAALGKVFSRSLPGLSILFAPLWLVEGTAVVAESELNGGGRGDDAFFEMLYKAPIVERSMFSLGQSGYTSHLAPGSRFYVGGYLIVNHVAETYGREVVAEISRRFAAFPFFGIGGPIRAVTGRSLRDLYNDMVTTLEQKYAGASDGVELWSPDRPGNYYLPTVTTSGTFFYRTRPDKRPAIVRVVSGGGIRIAPRTTEIPVVSVTLTDPGSWSVDPSGTAVYFTSFDVNNLHPAGQSIETNIYRHWVATGVTEQLTQGGGYNHPTVSPDGKSLLVVELAGGGPSNEVRRRRLVLFDVTDEGLGTKRIILDQGQSSVCNPAISPNGTMAAAAVSFEGRQDIVLVDLQSGSSFSLELPNELSAEYHPRFVDESILYFASDRGGALSIYELSVDDGTVRKIIDDRVGAYAAASVAGKVLFATYTSDGFGVRIVDTPPAGGSIAGTRLQEVTPSPPLPADDSESNHTNQNDPSIYADVPLPRYWYPHIEIAGGQAFPTDLGGGVTAGGSGVLQRNAWIAQAAYFPFLHQVQARAQWMSNWTPVSLGAESQLFYSVRIAGGNPVYVQSLVETLSLSAGILGDYRLGLQRSASISGSVRHVLEYTASSPFTIDQAFSGGVGGPTHYLFGSLGGSFASRPASPARALFPGWATAFSLAIGSAVPGIGTPPPGLQTRLSARLNVPLGFLDHVITPAVTATHSTSIATRSPVSLRGLGAPTDHTLTASLPGSAVVSLDYRAPLALVDAPLGLEFYLLGFGLTLFAETTVGFSVATPAVTADRYAAVGIELLTLLGWRTTIPVTLGISTQFDPGFASAPVWPRDLRFIFAIEMGDPLTRTPSFSGPGL